MGWQTVVWGCAILLFVTGDVATTAVGLELGLVETHPVGQTVLSSWGIAGLLALKALAVTGLWALAVAVRDDWAVGVPLGLAALGATLTAYNSLLIASVAA